MNFAAAAELVQSEISLKVRLFCINQRQLWGWNLWFMEVNEIHGDALTGRKDFFIQEKDVITCDQQLRCTPNQLQAALAKLRAQGKPWKSRSFTWHCVEVSTSEKHLSNLFPNHSYIIDVNTAEHVNRRPCTNAWCLCHVFIDNSIILVWPKSRLQQLSSGHVICWCQFFRKMGTG